MTFPSSPTNNQVYRDGKGRKYRYNSTMNAWTKEYEGLFVGAIVACATPNLPDGTLWADGGSVSRTTYADLYAAIGTRYGTPGDASTFFKPDLRGRVIVGLDSYSISDIPLAQRGQGAANRIPTSIATASFGQVFGSYQVQSNSHTLTIAEMPSHSHTYSAVTGTVTGDQNGGSGLRGLVFDTLSSSSVGGNAGHDHGLQNVLQPSMFLAYVIKY